MKATILVGCSASGKTTLAKSLGGNVIERDAFREFILYQKRIGLKKDKEYLNIPTPENKIPENIWAHWKFNWEPEVTKLVDEAIARSANAKMDIVISDTNLNPDRRSLLISKLEELGYEVSVEVVGQELTIDELWKRDLNRKNSVGHQVIAKQYAQFRKEFPLYQLTPVDDKPKAVIFDVDGTLARMNGKRGPFEWDKVGNDEPNMILFYTMKSLYEQGYKIIIMSGRDGVCREDTKLWINTVLTRDDMKIYVENELYSDYIDYQLFMRGENDHRSDVIVKYELFMKHIDGKYNVEAVFDDRPKVVRMWQDLGLNVVQCGNQNIEF